MQNGIYYSAFYGCSSLTSVIFESGSQLTAIGMGAFAITGLTTITIPASVTSISDLAFEGINGLTINVADGNTIEYGPTIATACDDGSCYGATGVTVTVY